MTFSNQGIAEQLLPRHNLQLEVTLTALNIYQIFSFYPTTLGGTLSTQSGIVRNYKSLKSQSKKKFFFLLKCLFLRSLVVSSKMFQHQVFIIQSLDFHFNSLFIHTFFNFIHTIIIFIHYTFIRFSISFIQLSFSFIRFSISFIQLSL
jgi:hypothetical protein